MKINILISTIDKGIEQVSQVLLEHRTDVHYIISHQYTDECYKYIPDCLDRSDVTISQIQGQGISKSRNNVIRLANGDIGLFADDDVTYHHSDIDQLKKTFLEHKYADVAVFKIRTPPGEREYKEFPNKILQYKSKAPSIGTVQIAFNISELKENKIWFDERFGVDKSLLIGGEERLFLHDCIKAGLQVFFFPEYVVEHHYMSTAKSIAKYDKRRNWVTGGTDYIINGPVAFLKAFGGTLKYFPDLIRNKVNPIKYFYHRISAVFYIFKTSRDRHQGN